MNSQDATRTRPSRDDVFPDEAKRLVGACDTLKDALGVALEVADFAERLGRQERSRLLHLVRLLRAAPEPGVAQVPSPDERADAEAYADAVENLPAARTERLQREAKLTAELARSLGFRPSGDERACLRGVSKGATLDTLAARLAAAAPERRRQAVNWAALEPGEAEELEALVEQALDDRGYFQRRRDDHAAGLKLELLARKAAEPGPMRTRAWPTGTIVLPAERLLADLTRHRLHAHDVAILCAVVSTFVTRRIDPRCERYCAWADGGDTLIVARGLDRLLPGWGDEVAPGFDAVQAGHADSERRLHKAQWLSIEEGERGLLRVRPGKRLGLDG